MKQAKYWIEKLELEKHPEGGWFKEIYRSSDIISRRALPNDFNGDRNCSTSIYYLLENEDFSSFHRIHSDEIWHYYMGSSSIEIISIQQGELKRQLLGNDPDSNQNLQIVVPKNTWFAAQLVLRKGYALVGCTVSPGFHFNDFELADEKLPDELQAKIVSQIRSRKGLADESVSS